MGHYTNQDNGVLSFNDIAKSDYFEATKYEKDSHVGYLLKALGFTCGKTRWWSKILWVHKTGYVEISIVQPKDNDWDQDPYADPQSQKAFVYQQSYFIRYPTKDPDSLYQVQPNGDFTHWLDLPSEIRRHWSALD